jgi:hypothetical protein
MAEGDVQIEKSEPLRLLHTGSRYSFGFGTDFYGIWDEAAPGTPVQQFPATSEGRQQAWQRYVQLEPSAAQSQARPSDTVIEYMGRPTSKRGRYILLGIVVVAGVAVFLANRGGGKGGTTGTGEGDTGTTAHVDVTGAVTVSEDLQQQAFTLTGLGSLTGGRANGDWKGATVELKIVSNPPTVGTRNTGQVTDNRTLEIDITQNGTTITALSRSGECQLTLDAVEDNGMKGSFTCKGVPAGTAGTIDATGTFGGTASS